MSDTLAIALTGILTQQRRFGVAADNIANMQTAGRVPTAENPASTVYRPQSVSLIALQAGGVRGEVVESKDGVSTAYDPSSVYANEQGYIAVPQVDLARELVNVLETKTLFRAQISVIKTQDEMMGDLLNTIA